MARYFLKRLQIEGFRRINNEGDRPGSGQVKQPSAQEWEG